MFDNFTNKIIISFLTQPSFVQYVHEIIEKEDFSKEQQLFIVCGVQPK